MIYHHTQLHDEALYAIFGFTFSSANILGKPTKHFKLAEAISMIQKKVISEV